MRIVHVVRQFYPAVGGLETMVRELASKQVAASHGVKVVTLDRLFKLGSKLLRVISLTELKLFKSLMSDRRVIHLRFRS